MPTLDVAQYGEATRGGTSLAQALLLLDSSGALVIMDVFAKLVMDGYGYQVRAGTVTTPLVGDQPLADAVAEYCVDTANGKVIIPISQNISIRLGTGSLHEYAVKSVATASTAGAAFVLLPLNIGDVAAVSTARVAAAGGVTVTAELATTTRRHWSFSQAIAAGAYVADCRWEPLRPPRIGAGNCLYTQIAATTTGPSYYANLDVLELAPAQIGF